MRFVGKISSKYEVSSFYRHDCLKSVAVVYGAFLALPVQLKNLNANCLSVQCMFLPAVLQAFVKRYAPPLSIQQNTSFDIE